MFSRLKTRMTYANVASTLALVVAVGGGGAAVAAAKLPANSVGSKQVINNSLNGQDIKDDRVKGADIDESTLGQVPSAANADAATTAGSANTATTANGLSAGAINNPNVFGTAALGVVRAYAWNSSASANATLTNYTYNRSGGAVNVVHNSAGDYTITFAGLNLSAGNVVVSGYGGGATWCKVNSWGSSSIGVLCFNSAGAPTDSRWTIAVTE
ncbi:hypothetical protein [Nocardioides sp.]|uniref:hypothetical protein n=1 Tax=Nocardioides sp. TaxID=35761 RepID=UPI0037845ADA